jgi:hypothetical protein
MILTSGQLPSTQILEVKGNGIALLDYNNNGMLDVFAPNGATLRDPEHGPGWRLYENLGEMTFRDVSKDAGITQTRWALGAAVADVDADGWQDIYVTCYGPNVLLRNRGDGTFEDITERAGVGTPGWSTSAAFGDITGDGWLDLYVTNYIEFDAANPPPSGRFLSMEVFAGPHGLPAQPDVLYFQNVRGSNTTFVDVSQPAGIHTELPAWGLGVVILDFDNDGLQDIYVGNDSMRNFLFHNQREAAADLEHLGDDQPTSVRLKEIGLRSGIGSNVSGANQATMGIGIADLTTNSLPDVFTTNFSSDMNTLHINVGNMLFEDRTSQHGLGIDSRPFLGWACGFFDFNLNGNEELLIVNGHIYPQATRALIDSDYEQPPLLYVRQPGRGVRFERTTDPAIGDWLNTPRRDRAMVAGDLDNDGKLDVLIGEMNGPIRVLHNESEPRGPWLIVQLRDERDIANGGANRRGLGARVAVSTGTDMKYRWIYSGGFLSANPAEAHFGLGWHTEPVQLQITWPDGYVQIVDDVQTNARITVTRE